MTTPRRTPRLRVLLPALAILTALTAYAAVAEKHAGPAGALRVAKAAQAVQGPAEAAPPAPAPKAPFPAGAGPASGPRPATSDAPPPAPARSRSAHVAPPLGDGDIGRPNPFAAPGFAQPPRPPARPGGMSFGLDLPLPPGAASLAVPAPPPPPPPGAGMMVGGIVGSGSERVAIIRVVGDVYVVGVGEQAGGADVVEIRDDKVVMRKGGQTFELLYGGGAQ